MRSFAYGCWLLAAVLTLPGHEARGQVLTLRSTTPLSTAGLGAAASATTLYALLAGAGNALIISAYDVRNAAAPVLLGSTPISATVAPSAPHNALLIGSTLFLSLLPEFQPAYRSRLLAFDVSNPAAPVLTGTALVSGYTLELAAGPGGELCVLPTATPPSSTFPPANDTQLLLFTSALQPISVTTIPAGGVRLSVSGQTAYVGYRGPAYLPVSLATPAAPVPQAAARPGSIGVVSGQLGFGLSYPSPAQDAVVGNALSVTNLSTPTAPAQGGTYAYASVGRDLLPAPSGVYTFSRYNPYYPFPTAATGPLAGYFTTSATAAPVAVAAPGVTYNPYSAAAFGNQLYVLTTSLAIYELSGVLATPAAVAPARPQPYPNPAHGMLHLPAAPGTAVALYDALGRCCLQATLPATSSLDLGALPAGLYQVRAGAASYKLVVE